MSLQKLISFLKEIDSIFELASEARKNPVALKKLLQENSEKRLPRHTI